MSGMCLTEQKCVLPLSSLPHTWLLDLDGTIVKHNGYKIDGTDSLLDGAKAFLDSISQKDMIIFLTSRTEEFKDLTERFLRDNNIRYDMIIYNIPYGERIVVNDDKPSGLKMALAVEKKRDAALNLTVYEAEDKIGRQGMEITGGEDKIEGI